MVRAVWPHAAMLQAPGKHAATSTYCAEQKFLGLKARDLSCTQVDVSSCPVAVTVQWGARARGMPAHPCLVRVKNRELFICVPLREML